MKYKFSHQQRLYQKMSLTPQLRQSIQLLSMSCKDLNDYIDSAIAQNPFLQKAFDKKMSGVSQNPPTYEYKEEARQEINLRSTLLSQIRMMDLNEKELEIAEFLTYEMDDNGYIMTDPNDAADDLGVSVDEVAKCTEIIQRLEPAGIGARSLSECLLLQLKRKNKEGSLEYRIVESFLNEVAKNDAERISKALKADMLKVRDAITNIKRLNPRPASTLLSREIEKVVPELVARVTDKKVRLEVNKTSLPRLKIYNPHQDDLDIIKDAEAREFLKANIGVAKQLIDNLKWREKTICKVADYILRFQKEALRKGGQDMIKSLAIKDVARALNFHPSTISRTVSNKFIQINDKVMPLKELLSSGVKKENGEVTSKVAIKKTIETMIKNEDSTNPLTDSAIKEKLKTDGIFLTRRTVAKYRTEMRTLPVYLRKKMKLPL